MLKPKFEGENVGFHKKSLMRSEQNLDRVLFRAPNYGNSADFFDVPQLIMVSITLAFA